jgi:hypothetical protein
MEGNILLVVFFSQYLAMPISDRHRIKMIYNTFACNMSIKNDNSFLTNRCLFPYY